MTNPEPTHATLALTIDGEPVDIGEWLRGLIREQVTEAFNQIAGIIGVPPPSAMTIKGAVGEIDIDRLADGIAGQAPQAGELIHEVPETSMDERVHVLDTACWCRPTVDGQHVVHYELQP